MQGSKSHGTSSKKGPLLVPVVVDYLRMNLFPNEALQHGGHIIVQDAERFLDKPDGFIGCKFFGADDRATGIRVRRHPVGEVVALDLRVRLALVKLYQQALSGPRERIARK